MKSLKTTVERKTADSYNFSFLILLVLIFVFLLVAINVELSIASIGSSSPPNDDTSGRSMVTPDLFTGTITYSVPIDVPPGRKSMAPNLAITY